MILYFVHGWGFDAGLWERVVALLPEWRCAVEDRGYFGTPHEPELGEPVVAITHSFGTMRVLAEPPPQCRGLIAINGFDCFTAREGFPGVPPRVVDRMLMRFTSDAETVLSDFRRRCGSDAPFDPSDAALLWRDLQALRDLDCRAESAAWQTPILSLQGELDPILPATMRDNLFPTAPQIDRVTEPEAGHLLPVTHAELCARHIKTFVEALQ